MPEADPEPDGTHRFYSRDGAGLVATTYRKPTPEYPFRCYTPQRLRQRTRGIDIAR